MRIGRAARASVTARSGAAATSSAESGTRSQTGTTAGLASSCVVPSCAVPSGAGAVSSPAGPGPVVGPDWDLVPDSALDVAAAPERAVTEALAVLPVLTDDGEVLYLLDTADNTWVRSPWPAPTSENLQVQALSPDGRSIAHTVYDGERPRCRSPSSRPVRCPTSTWPRVTSASSPPSPAPTSPRAGSWPTHPTGRSWR